MAKTKTLTREGLALLEAIAGNESKGDYAVVYGDRPGKGSITDFSKHPNRKVKITSGPHKGDYSSAAGKYQFLGRTWRGLQSKYADLLPDFEPQTQDLGAWLRAQDVYASATNGRDLQADLESGDPKTMERIGTALSSEWTSLPGGIEATQGGDHFAGVYNNALSTVAGHPVPPIGIRNAALGVADSVAPPPLPRRRPEQPFEPLPFPGRLIAPPSPAGLRPPRLSAALAGENVPASFGVRGNQGAIRLPEMTSGQDYAGGRSFVTDPRTSELLAPARGPKFEPGMTGRGQPSADDDLKRALVAWSGSEDPEILASVRRGIPMADTRAEQAAARRVPSVPETRDRGMTLPTTSQPPRTLPSIARIAPTSLPTPAGPMASAGRGVAAGAGSYLPAPPIPRPPLPRPGVGMGAVGGMGGMAAGGAGVVPANIPPVPMPRPMMAAVAPQPQQRPQGQPQVSANTQQMAAAPPPRQQLVRLASGKMVAPGSYRNESNGITYIVSAGPNGEGIVTPQRKGFDLLSEATKPTVLGGIIRSKVPEAMSSMASNFAPTVQGAANTAIDKLAPVTGAIGSGFSFLKGLLPGGSAPPQVPAPRPMTPSPMLRARATGPSPGGGSTIYNNPTKYGATQAERNAAADERARFLAQWGG